MLLKRTDSYEQYDVDELMRIHVTESLNCSCKSKRLQTSVRNSGYY